LTLFPSAWNIDNMADIAEKKPILDPERELPAPHDMELEAGYDVVLPASGKIPVKKRRIMRMLFPILVMISYSSRMWNISFEYTIKLNMAVPLSEPTPTVTPERTADWKTYLNTKSKISFQYPADWEVKTAIDSSMITLAPKNDLVRIIGGPIEKNSIDTFINTQYKNQYERTISKKVLNNTDLKAIKYHITYSENAPASGPSSFNTIIFEGSKKYYFEKPGAGSEDVLEKILATFKFLDQVSVEYNPNETNDFPVYPGATFI
jgi:hypothetical protein